jgi:uncharacterized protein YbjT (DUF2867 family)
MAKLNVIITGATGMIGEGVLHVCLNHKDVENILVISRKPTGYSHPKLKEIIHSNFLDISTLNAQLKGYNACYFCLGVTSMGRNETEYTKMTHFLTVNFAKTLAQLNHDMTFCYISGVGTDSSEQGRIMWARVKGKTENDLMKLPFKNVFNLRPGLIAPFLPLKPTQTYYKTYRYISWLVYAIKKIAPGYVVGLKELAGAMIRISLNGYEKNILEVRDIRLLGKE